MKKSHTIQVTIQDLLTCPQFNLATSVPIPRSFFAALNIDIKEASPTVIEEAEPTTIEEAKKEEKSDKKDPPTSSAVTFS